MDGPGSVIASAVGKEIIKRIGDEAALQWRFKKDVLNMEEHMKNLEGHLLDADDKSREGDGGGRVEQDWLMKFKHVAYDTEDVLDELDANKLIEKNQSKVIIQIMILWSSCVWRKFLCVFGYAIYSPSLSLLLLLLAFSPPVR
jgi:hypothetical protein